MFFKLKSNLKNKLGEINSEPHIARFSSYIKADKKHLAILIILVLAIPLTLTLALTQQELRQRAAGLDETSITPPDITPTPTPTGFPSVTPTVVPTVTPVPTPTPKPTKTPKPTPVQKVVIIYPAADAYVSAASPKTNFGNSNLLLVSTNPVANSYLRFSFANLVKNQFVSAKLFIHVNSGFNGPVTMRNVSNIKWQESTINYNNRPTNDKDIIGGFSSGTTGSWLSIDISNYVKSKVPDFATLDFSTNADIKAAFDSRDSNFPPRVEVTIKQ